MLKRLKNGCQKIVDSLKSYKKGKNPNQDTQFVILILGNPNLTLFFVWDFSYIREKEMEEEMLMQRREEEGRGKERRKALLEKEERKWKEIEATLISSIPNAGSREAAAMSAAVRAVGGDSVLDDSFARERVSSIAKRIRATQLSRRALQVIPNSHFIKIIILSFFLKKKIKIEIIILGVRREYRVRCVFLMMNR